MNIIKNLLKYFENLYLCKMDKQICNKCSSEKLVFENFEYCGEYAAHNYLCLECQDQGTIYYDIQYTLINDYFKNNETIQTIKKAKA